MPVETRFNLRLTASALALVLAALAAVPAFGQSNPLIETPAAGRAAEDAPGEPQDGAPAAAEVQGVEEERAAANPTATEIIRSLAPFADGNPNAPRRYRDVDSDGRKVRVDYGRAIDLTVFFGYDSFRLTPEARIQLEPLGRALQSEKLAGRRFLIAGHTDAAGGRAYNRRLSLRRAVEVKAYLVATFGIDPERLVAYGWGESRLKDERSPFARINRRVEVALIDDRRSSGPDTLRYYRPAAYEGCGLEEIGDPRLRTPLDLDDFGAAPAAVCAQTLDMDDLTQDSGR